MKPGLYYTEYGNVAKVSRTNAKTAYDIDMAERIPIELVDETKPVHTQDSKSVQDNAAKWTR